MQTLRVELDRARALRAEATDIRAKDALDGVILALHWAIEDGTQPSCKASRYRTDPLDHDNDGKPGGSRRGKLATARKRK